MRDKTKLAEHLTMKLGDLGFRVKPKGSAFNCDVFANGKLVAIFEVRQKYRFSDPYVVLKHAGMEPRDDWARDHWLRSPHNQWNWQHRVYRSANSVVTACRKFMDTIPDAHAQRVAKAREKAYAAYRRAESERNLCRLSTRASIDILDALTPAMIAAFDESTRTEIEAGREALSEHREAMTTYERLNKEANKIEQEKNDDQ